MNLSVLQLSALLLVIDKSLRRKALMENPSSQTPKKRINHKLRQARLKKLWTLQAAAKAAQVSFTTFLRWEHAQQEPSLVNLERLCQTFNTTPEQLGYGHLVGYDDSASP